MNPSFVPPSSIDVSVMRPLGMPWYTCYQWDTEGAAGQRLCMLGAFVVDDFGTLVPITGHAYAAAERFWHSHSQGQEEAAAQWEREQQLGTRAQERRDFEAVNTRRLLRPEPIVVEIGEPDAEHGDVSVHVGPDARDAGTEGPPLYRITVAGNEYIWCTHAQLAALGVAAQHLCRPSSRTPRGPSTH